MFAANQGRRTSCECITCRGWGTGYYTTTLKWRRNRAGSRLGNWRAQFTTKLVRKTFWRLKPVWKTEQLKSAVTLSCLTSCFFCSEIWEDQILGDCFEELRWNIRLGPQTLSQVHGLQGNRSSEETHSSYSLSGGRRRKHFQTFPTNPS